MVLRRVVAVAALAVRIAGVIELHERPILGAQVTAAALARIVVLRRVVAVTTLAILRGDVVELHLEEIDGIVAQIARNSHLPVVRVIVAGRTPPFGSLVRPLDVTALAVRRGVRAFQGKRMLFQRVSGKSDGARRDRGAWGGRGRCARQRFGGHRAQASAQPISPAWPTSWSPAPGRRSTTRPTAVPANSYV